MLQYLSRKFATQHRISIERLVSGNGLANVRLLLLCFVVFFSVFVVFLLCVFYLRVFFSVSYQFNVMLASISLIFAAHPV